MASTYSELKIELMATGENSGTWGDTTNTNLGTALGEAITGSADVTFASADVNLTLTDTNTAQTARNLRLNIVGTLGASRYMYLSTGCNIEKFYLVNNGSAYAVTVQNKIAGTASGSTVTVPAGKSMLIYNTGTNIVDAATHFTAVSLTTPLAVTSGGTGGTTSTGSGAVVLATSPTLVTPALGTPASGNFSTGTFTWPTFNQSTTGNALTATTATNIAGGTTSQIPYQSAAGTTSFITAPTGTGSYLQWNGTAYVWGGTAGVTTNAATFNDGGAGAASGTTFNGSTARTISYNTVGASPLAGSTSITTLGTVTTGTWSASTIGATKGGTGQSTYAVGDLLVGGATNTLDKLADVATGNALISGGVGVAPSYGKIGLATHVSGTLPIANGGTGVTTLTGLAYGNGTSAFTAATGAQISTALGATAVTNATNATNATQITNAGGWGITPSGTTLFFSYNGTNVAKLTSAGDLTVIGDVTAYGSV